jgi:hypothetical protein
MGLLLKLLQKHQIGMPIANPLTQAMGGQPQVQGRHPFVHIQADDFELRALRSRARRLH